MECMRVDVRAIVLIVVGILTAFFSFWVSRLKVETDITEALPEWAPAKKAYDRLGELFPSRDFFLIVIEAEDVFGRDFLTDIAEITSAIEEIKGIYAVISPTNMKVLKEEGGTLFVKTAMELADTNRDGWEERLRNIVLKRTLFREHLLSEDERFAGIMVFMEKVKEPEKVVKEVMRTVREKVGGKYHTYFSGRPVTNYYLGEGMAKDMGTLMPVAFILMLIILYLTFRSVRGVLLPIGVVSLANLWTMGTMALLGVSHSHSTNIMPILIFSIGIADSIHFLSRYYALSEEHTDGKELTWRVFKDLYPALIFTSLTTVAGFMALATANIHSLTKLAIFTSIGVMYALFLTLTLLPAVLSLLPVQKRRGRSAKFEKFFRSYYEFLIRHRRSIVVFIIFLVLFMMYGFTKLRVRFDSIENFRVGSEIRKAYNVINAEMGGSTTLSIMVEKGEGEFLKPDNIKRLKEFTRFMKSLPHVRDAVSIADLIEEMHCVLKGKEGGCGEEIGEFENVYDPELNANVRVRGEEIIAQYIGMYELSGAGEQLNNMINYSFSAVHILTFLDTEDRDTLKKVREMAVKKLDALFPGSYLIDGMSEVVITVNDLIVEGQKRSLITSLLTVSGFSAIEFLSIIYGFLSAIPLFFSLLFNFGIMGLTGIPVNLMTMVTSNIAIGVGVDYAIHFLHRYRRVKDTGETVEITGPPIMFNAITTGLGFSILTLSQFVSVATMGFLIALAMLTASLGTLLIFPIILKNYGGEK